MARTKHVTDISEETKAKKASKKALLQKSLEKDGKKKARLSDGAGGIKKPHRWRRGTVACREVRKYQSGRSVDGTRNLVPKTSLGRRIRDKAADYTDDVRFQGNSLDAVQQSTEALVVDILADTARLTALRKLKMVTRDSFLFIISMYFRDYKNYKKKQEAAAESARLRRERHAEL